MTALGLFFVGSVLLVNGLGLLGLVGPKASAPIRREFGPGVVSWLSRLKTNEWKRYSEAAPDAGGSVSELEQREYFRVF